MFWNLLGGFWMGILVVFATPRFVASLGLEGYGLVGLWTMMQVMVGILDLGMGATIVREFASADAKESKYCADLLQTLEWVYGSMGLVLAALLAIAAEVIANHWLRVQTLTPGQAGLALRLMALTLGFQLPTTLYMNGLAGLQDHRTMNFIQMVGNGMRYGGGVAILAFFPAPVPFFALQAVVAGGILLASRGVLQKMIRTRTPEKGRFRIQHLGRIWRFSAGMAATAVAGLLVGNMDRLMLSHLVTTLEVGKYSVAFTATGLVQMGIQPFYRAYFPRFAELVAAGDSRRLRIEYFKGCQLMGMVIIPLALLGWCFAGPIFNAWMGKPDATIAIAFKWLLLGIACAGLMWLPAALQQAQGWTGLHVAMMAGAVILGTPLMTWCVRHYGSPGAAVVWVLHGTTDVTLGLWLMHRRVLVGDFNRWVGRVILPPLTAGLLVVPVSALFLPAGASRFACLGWIAVTGLLAFSIAWAMDSLCDRWIPLDSLGN